jgi:hypothetical protein
MSTSDIDIRWVSWNRFCNFHRTFYRITQNDTTHNSCMLLPTQLHGKNDLQSLKEQLPSCACFVYFSHRLPWKKTDSLVKLTYLLRVHLRSESKFCVVDNCDNSRAHCITIWYSTDRFSLMTTFFIVESHTGPDQSFLINGLPNKTRQSVQPGAACPQPVIRLRRCTRSAGCVSFTSWYIDVNFLCFFFIPIR